METGQKLDNIQDTVTELRVSMATLSGDVRASLAKHEAADRIGADVERRIRTLESDTGTVTPDVESRLRLLERRNYAVPTVATLLGLAGLLLAAWAAFRPH